MICKKLSSQNNIKKLLKLSKSTKEGLNIMSKKAKLEYFLIKDLKNPAANILKQEALSLGADFAVPKGVIICEKQRVDGVLFISQAKLKHLIKKISIQPFGLKELAKELKKHLNTKEFKPKIMGVLNANDDSFFSGSRFDKKSAVSRIEQMISHGVDMIDIGAVSSRPGSEGVSEKEELTRLKPIIEQIYKHKLYEKVIFSLDSYSPLCLEFVFDRGFSIANDIQGLANDEVARVCGRYNATVCIMHMLNNPKTMQNNPHYDDVVDEIDRFFTTRVKKAKKFGIKNIVLDAGIGFGKTLEHNLTLIKASEHFLHHGYEILVGASRKSLIEAISPSDVEQRLAGTLALHLEAIRCGASIIRCHDTYEHIQALKVYEALQKSIG